jgi:hypothetical protein
MRTKLNIKNKLKDIFVFYQSKKRGEKKRRKKKKHPGATPHVFR